MAEVPSTNSSTNSKTPHPPPPPQSARRPIVQLVDVWKTYATGSVPVHALRGVSVSVYPGEYISIVGPSGSGKSTFMHMLGCLDVPTSGRYLLAGTTSATWTRSSWPTCATGASGSCSSSSTSCPACRPGATSSYRSSTQGSTAGAGGRGPWPPWTGWAWRTGSTTCPTQLSGGQQQRVAVARALVTEPALILADEPTGNLDSRSSADVLGMLDDLHRSGRTIVLITHEQDVAEAAERIMRFRDGKFVGQDEVAPRELVRHRAVGHRGHHHAPAAFGPHRARHPDRHRRRDLDRGPGRGGGASVKSAISTPSAATCSSSPPAARRRGWCGGASAPPPP